MEYKSSTIYEKYNLPLNISNEGLKEFVKSNKVVKKDVSAINSIINNPVKLLEEQLFAKNNKAEKDAIGEKKTKFLTYIEVEDKANENYIQNLLLLYKELVTNIDELSDLYFNNLLDKKEIRKIVNDFIGCVFAHTITEYLFTGVVFKKKDFIDILNAMENTDKKHLELFEKAINDYIEYYIFGFIEIDFEDKNYDDIDKVLKLIVEFPKRLIQRDAIYTKFIGLLKNKLPINDNSILLSKYYIPLFRYLKKDD